MTVKSAKLPMLLCWGEKRARQKADESLAAAVNALDGAFRRFAKHC